MIGEHNSEIVLPTSVEGVNEYLEDEDEAMQGPSISAGN